jgi:hypothetical protein
VRDPAGEVLGEAAFALVYFQRETDLIPDSIHAGRGDAARLCLKIRPSWTGRLVPSTFKNSFGRNLVLPFMFFKNFATLCQRRDCEAKWAGGAVFMREFVLFLLADHWRLDWCLPRSGTDVHTAHLHTSVPSVSSVRALLLHIPVAIPALRERSIPPPRGKPNGVLLVSVYGLNPGGIGPNRRKKPIWPRNVGKGVN